MLCLYFIVLPIGLAAQQTVEISEVNVQELDHELLRVEVTVRNVGNKTISEIGGYLDCFDRTGQRIDKLELNVLLQSDLPLKPGQIARRSLIINPQPTYTANFRYRIKRLRFFGEIEIYQVCPSCGELILQD